MGLRAFYANVSNYCSQLVVLTFLRRLHVRNEFLKVIDIAK
jgi:hypothetical protein